MFVKRHFFAYSSGCGTFSVVVASDTSVVSFRKIKAVSSVVVAENDDVAFPSLICAFMAEAAPLTEDQLLLRPSAAVPISCPSAENGASRSSAGLLACSSEGRKPKCGTGKTSHERKIIPVAKSDEKNTILFLALSGMARSLFKNFPIDNKFMLLPIQVRLSPLLFLPNLFSST